jgi:SPP1 gp7 family putative phage head morphogenesis protein
VADVYQLSQAFRAALLARDTQAAARLIAAYELGASRLEANLRQLLASVEAARARGETITDGWLYRQARFRELIQQAQQEMLRLADFSDGLITDQQRAEIERGLRDSATLMETAAGEIGINPSFAQAPKAAVENLVGALGDGSPLRGVLGRYGIDGAAVIERELIAGLVAGEPIAKVARRMRSAVGGNLDKALQIARNETLRAYRESSRQNYLANAEYISGYIWVATKQVKTCAACLALDGQFFPLDKPMPAHVACRCSSYAALKGEAPRQRETAGQWFMKQPDSVKEQVLPKNAVAALNAGEVSLTDFVGRTDSEKWGSSYHQLSLKRALAGEGKFPDDSPPK